MTPDGRYSGMTAAVLMQRLVPVFWHLKIFSFFTEANENPLPASQDATTPSKPVRSQIRRSDIYYTIDSYEISTFYLLV